MIARRLLMGGSGSFTPPVVTPNPPDDTAWARTTAYNPILTAHSGEWNEYSIDGPSVRLVDGTWHGWYTGNGPEGVLTGAMDSTDGYTWTWHLTGGLDIPVIGNGIVVAGQTPQPMVEVWDGTYFYCFFDDYDNGKVLSACRSTDGYTWTDLARDILAFPSGVDQWANTGVIKIGSTWYALACGHTSTTAVWQVFWASASDPLGTWTIGNSGNPITSLQAATNGMYGSNDILLMNDGLIHTYYHAASASGVLPTDLYTATISLSDFEAGANTWTIGNGGAPILTHSGSGYEHDQVADPKVVWSGTEWRMYFSAVASQSPFSAVLEMATTAAT